MSAVIGRADGSGLPRGLARVYHGWRAATVVAALLSGVAIFAMMCFIVADVFSRNVLGGSISGSFEIAEKYFMPVAVFPALAYVYGTGVLPRMDLLRTRLPTVIRAAVVHLLLLLELVMFAVLVHYTWGYAVDGQERGVAFPAGGDLYTLWPLFYLVPMGFLMLAVETLFVIARNLTGGPVALGMTHEEDSPS